MSFVTHRVVVLSRVLCGLLLAPSTAGATEVAVLEFSAYGVGYDDAALVTQGFRDAFLEDGRFFPLESYDISDRLSAGRESDVSEARTLVGQARGLLDSGQTSRALGLLDRALTLHEDLESALGLRSELADALFFRAVAASKLGRSQEAERYLVKTLEIYPDYDTGRAVAIPSSLRTPMSRAKARRLQTEPGVPDSTVLDSAASRLGVEVMVVGYVDGPNSRIYARLLVSSRVRGEVSATAREMPPFSGDPAYLRMVEELLAGVDSRSITPQPGGSTPDFEAIPTFEEDEPYEARTEPIAQPRVAEERRDDEPPLPGATGSHGNTGLFGRQRRSGTIRGTRSYNRSSEPVTEQWWFWTIAAAVVVGGGAALALVAARTSDEDPGESGDPNTYRLTIETSN